jgi:N4-gp56 family major capsid protein
MNLKQELNLQLFADAGTLVNASGNYVNAYSGETSAFPDGGGMTASMKTFYDTELLENARPELIHTQFARKQALPAGRGKTVEWRKWNTLEDAGALTEGVIPTGQKFGQSAVTQAITQYGTYVSVSDQLELHAIDDVILGAAEELGASAGTTQDRLVRNVAAAGTNVQYCDKVGTNGAHTAVTSRAGLDTTAKLTPDEVNKAVTLLKKLKAPKIDGKYIAIIHPSVAYDLRSSEAWIEAHKYAGLTELFTGEIGELHGVRFIETTEAKIFNGEGCPVKTAADTSKGTPAVYYSVYATLFLGKDAYGMIDPEGGNLEMIIKDKGQVGGPLNQFSTLGYKFSSAAKILYEDRMVRVESCGAYSAEDEAN